MSGLCGWLAADGIEDPDALLTGRMVPALADGMKGGDHAAAQTTNALALTGAPEELSWHSADGLTAAIVGYPKWQEGKLQALSRAQGHAAALVESYRRHGSDLLEHLFGHFVFALLDSGRDRVFCAIDRFGVYRLCYATPRTGHFVFSTSADAVRTYPGVDATISPQTLYQYLFFIDRVAAPGTIYDEQNKLRAGEALLFDRGDLRCWRYWQLDYSRHATAQRSELHRALRDQLEGAVRRSLAHEDGDRTASFLSGGLDSSTVAGYFAQLNERRGRCITIGFEHADFDETPFARIAAEHFGLKHEVFMVGPEQVLAVLPRLSTAFDEPYSNSSAIPSYYCAQVSREGGDAMILAGDGGDELFGGNTRYLKDDVFGHYQKIPTVLRRGLLEPLLLGLPWPARIALLRRAKNYVRHARRSVADRMTSHNAFAFAAADRVFSAEALAAIDPAGPTRFADDLYESAAGDAKIQKMMNFDLQLTLADSDLRKVLTSCTLAGMRVRFPMLDDDLAAFSGTVPPGLLTEGARVRQFYKQALAGFLPQAIIDKPKQGFGLPMFQYIAESQPLADFFCDALSDLKQRAFLSPAFLDRMIDEVHQGRPGSHAGIVWDLAVLEVWMASRSGAADSAGRPGPGPQPAARAAPRRAELLPGTSRQG